ncbi:MAG: subtilisin [Bacteroidetes bacterium]|nr:MAG: subtilisin [Bacteroidota bacterium]
MIYTLGFAVLVFGLVGALLPDLKWKLGSQSVSIDPLSRLVPVGAVLWVGALWTQSISAQAFFAQAFRDLVFLLGAAMLLKAVEGMGRYTVAAALLVAVGMVGVHHQRAAWSGKPPNEQEQLTTGDMPGSAALASDSELLVELRPGTSLAVWQEWVAAQGWRTQQAFAPADGAATDLDDYWLIDLPQAANWTAALQRIDEAELADWAEPNEVIRLEVLPARITPPLNQKLGVDDPGVREQWALGALQVEALYELLTTREIPIRKRALVAILDTGVDAQHEDLRDNFRSISKKYDDDPRGHGTHCAGIAGAVTNNGVGVASLARSTEYFDISSVKVLRAQGSGTQKDIIAGMIEAVDAGADVISMSLGGFSTQARQRAYNEAVRYANDKGCIVVAAAGNSNRDAATYTPVNAKGVIGVSAIDAELQRAVFSNRVDRIGMAVAAPGVGIYSTKPHNNYDSHNGTSMATPFVSGLLGLMKSIRPELTTREAYSILNRTGVATRNTAQTGKLIQPAAALSALLAETAAH